MGFFIFELALIFGSPFSVIIFGAGIIVGYLLSENQRTRQNELEQAYDELNDMLLEKEGRIDKLEEYIDKIHKQQIEEPSKAAQKSSISPSEKEDLTRIEGVGSKTAEILHQSGIYTYKDLSETSLDSLIQILGTAGAAYLRHGHETWAKQAHFAANGEWDALEAWQNG